MTLAALATLRSCWWRLAALSPPRPSAALVTPWDPDPAEAVSRKSVEDASRPDFGFLFASRYVECRGSGRLKSLGTRERRGLLPPDEAGFAWIHRAVAVLEAERRGDGPDAGDPHHRAVRTAIGLNADPATRHLLQVLLVSRGATLRKVADALELDAAAVTAFADLFFNVIDRRTCLIDFFGIGSLLASGRDFQTGAPLPPPQAALLGEAAWFGFAEQLPRCGAGGAGAAAPRDEIIRNGLDRLNRRLLLCCGGGPQAFPGLESFLAHARETAGAIDQEDEKRQKEVPYSFKEDWERSKALSDAWNDGGEDLPQDGPRPESSADAGHPDLALDLDSIREWEQEEEEPEPPLAEPDWDRLPPAGIECEPCVIRARELHADAAARHLLQAALISRDAAVAPVAQKLGLQVAEVAAYQRLCFKASGASRQSAAWRQITAAMEAGRDPVSGLPLPGPFAPLLRAAPHLSLAQVAQAAGGGSTQRDFLRNLDDLDQRRLLFGGGQLTAVAMREFKAAVRQVAKDQTTEEEPAMSDIAIQFQG